MSVNKVNFLNFNPFAQANNFESFQEKEEDNNLSDSEGEILDDSDNEENTSKKNKLSTV